MMQWMADTVQTVNLWPLLGPHVVPCCYQCSTQFFSSVVNTKQTKHLHILPLTRNEAKISRIQTFPSCALGARVCTVYFRGSRWGPTSTCVWPILRTFYHVSITSELNRCFWCGSGFRMPPEPRLFRHASPGRDPGLTQNLLEGLHIPTRLETSRYPPGRAGKRGWREGPVEYPIDQLSGRRWMHGLLIINQLRINYIINFLGSVICLFIWSMVFI